MQVNYKCVPYLKTYGSEAYKKFLQFSFDERFIANTNDVEAILFADWQVKDKGNYRVYTNIINNRYMIEYYSVGYNIITSTGTKHIPTHPQNLDQFITDCQRSDLDLFWDKKISGLLSYKDFMEPKAIEEYHNYLLEKLGKLDTI